MNLTVNSLSSAEIEALQVVFDVDESARSVVALGAAGNVGKEWEHARHHHRKAQLLYTVRGIINCEVENGVWIVPPQCAVWIPAGLQHAARGSGETECYCLFIEPNARADLPAVCCTLAVSPLLRELIFSAAGFPFHAPLSDRAERLVATLFDELVAAPVEELHLPLPGDPRLRRLADLLLADPTAKITIAEWSTRIGMSERSMTRLLMREIGMSFGRWRRQLHIILALRRLSKGDSVQAVALDLGYENASGFVTMFRKALGKPPARYLADRKAASAGIDSQPPVSGIVLSATH